MHTRGEDHPYDAMEFAMAHHSSVFLEVPAFQRALGGRLCALLMSNLRGWDQFEGEVHPRARTHSHS